MLDLYLIVNIAIVVALFGMSFAVLIKNKKSSLNINFFILTFCIAVWVIANYISNDTSKAPETATIANYFVFLFSYLAAVYLLKFSIVLSHDTRAKAFFSKYRIIIYSIAFIAPTPLVVKGVQLQGSVYAVIFGPLSPIYFLSLGVILFGSFYIIYRRAKHTLGTLHQQLDTFFKTLIWGLSLVIISNFLLPAFIGWFGLSNIGNLSLLLFVYGIFYIVIKHRLFDLRLTVVRSLAYLLTLGVLISSYSLITHKITSLTSAKLNNSLLNELINIIFIGIVVVSFKPLKKQFDRLTSKLFYRDAYEIQDLLSEFNQTIVSTIDLEQLLIKVSEIIAKYIKADYCEFAIRQNDTDTIRVIGPEGAKATKETVEQIRAYSKKYSKKIIVTDELDERDEDLKFILDKTEIGLLARITSDKKIEGIGYLILGFKKSGNPFSLQDKKATDIITNGLVVAIQNALQFEEIQLFNITLQQKVDDATKELKKTNEKLRALDETKDEFISMASHQLRTPLTSVKGYVSMVLEGDAGELKPTQKKMLKQAFFSSQRMVYLIADLLNVSRLKTGKFVIENKPTNLADVIAGEVDQLRETAEGKGLELIYKKPKNFPDLMLDETKIRQVIMNFADNAVHYTPSGGTVTLNLEHKPGVIEFTVVDDGLGVPKHDQHHLFSKFYRAKNAQKARPDGTGLGLFMAKKVIVAQGGSIIFSSEEGKGSVFGFAFAVDKLDALPKKQ